jgi:hypothetical protein
MGLPLAAVYIRGMPLLRSTRSWRTLVPRCPSGREAHAQLASAATGASLMLLAWASVMAAVVPSISACSDDECEEGESRCQGRELSTCERRSCHDPGCAFGRGNRWKVATCEDACVKPGSRAFCALSTEPDPRCTRDNLVYCDGTDAVWCLGGFAIEREPCSETGRVCVIGDWLGAICAVSAAPNAACRELAGPYSELCDGAQLVTCYGSHVTSIRTCSAACVAPESGDSFCAAASEPDPRCAPASFAPVACPGDMPARCNSGYVECVESMTTADEDAGQD